MRIRLENEVNRKGRVFAAKIFGTSVDNDARCQNSVAITVGCSKNCFVVLTTCVRDVILLVESLFLSSSYTTHSNRVNQKIQFFAIFNWIISVGAN